MLGAIGPSSDPFGGLEGYLQQARGPGARGVPRRAVQFANGAGAKTKPGADVPTPAQPFKTSGATPGKASNELIPYTRVTPLNSSFLAAKPGHVSFVSATGSYPLGRTANVQRTPERRNLCFSLDALNNLLKCDGTAEDANRTLPIGNVALDSWRRVPLLREWRLDGVMLGVDTPENESQVLNVGIAGICRYVVNHFDTLTMFALDVLYVGLIAVPTPGKNGIPARYEFHYCLFTSRSLTAGSGGVGGFPHGAQSIHDYVGEEGHPWRATRLHLMVGAWKVGKVVDIKAVFDKDATYHSQSEVRGKRLGAEHALGVLIDVEWHDWRMLRRMWGTADVASIAPDGTVTPLQTDAARLKVGAWHSSRSIIRTTRTDAVFNWPSEMPSEAGVLPMRPFNPDDLIGSDPNLTAAENLDVRKRLLRGLSEDGTPPDPYNGLWFDGATDRDCTRPRANDATPVPEPDVLAAADAALGAVLTREVLNDFRLAKRRQVGFVDAQARALHNGTPPIQNDVAQAVGRLQQAVRAVEDAIYEAPGLAAVRDYRTQWGQLDFNDPQFIARLLNLNAPAPDSLVFKADDVGDTVKFLTTQPYDDPLYECDELVARLSAYLRHFVVYSELVHSIKARIVIRLGELGRYAYQAPVDIYNAYRPATWTYNFARQRDPTEPGEPPANAQDPLDPNTGIVAYRPA
jgi:hypothetical protein